MILKFIAAAAAAPAKLNNSDPTAFDQYKTNLPSPSAGNDQLQQILTIVFGVAAALAVLMIVVAGLRFVVGQGNPQEVAKARSTIIYAVAGLLIALTAEAIVSLAIGKL